MVVTLKQDVLALTEEKQKMRDTVEDASNYVLQIEQKVYKSNKISLELLKQLKALEAENQQLRETIMRHHMPEVRVYVPYGDDYIDRKLAEYINNYPEGHKL